MQNETKTDIKFFITHTSNCNSKKMKNPLFHHVIAGSCFQTEPIPDDVYLDNSGEHISELNKAYCELTTQYWAWKNINADYYGFCHYRRYFSFNKNMLPETVCGIIEFDELNIQNFEILNNDEKVIHEYVEKYDFLIAKGISTYTLNASNVLEHYRNAEKLYEKDISIFLDIIHDKYPDLYQTACDFFEGNIFYPCNMFIMKNELFQEYSAMLFDILDEFMKRVDMSNYSREGYRTPGHLGERLAGIFYLYKKNTSSLRLGELQIALFHHTDNDVSIQAKKNAIPIVLAADQNYVPILYTCMQSIISHTSADRIYEIYVFHTNIEQSSQKMFLENLQKDNIKINFINVSSYVAGYQLEAKAHITTETFYRFLILDILRDFPKVVYLDSDMIICEDIASLYDIDLGDNLIGAASDSDFLGQCNKKDSDMMSYAKQVLHMENPFQYFQAGVLLLNVEKLRQITTVHELFKMADTNIYRFSDQDILNIICKNKVLYLDMKWNLLFDCTFTRIKDVISYAPHETMTQYELARKEPFIIHYAGHIKPWQDPTADFATEFWQIARTTPYYEELLYNMCGQKKQRRSVTSVFVDILRKFAKKVLPQGSWIRRTVVAIYRKFK